MKDKIFSRRLLIVFMVSVFFVALCLPFFVSADEVITDLTGTTWSWNLTEHPVFAGNSQTNTTKSILFTSNDEEFTALSFYVNSSTTSLSYTPNTPDGSVWFWDGAHLNTKPDYQVIHITGGTGVTDTQLIGWITANATQVIDPMGDLVSDVGSFFSSSLSWVGDVADFITDYPALIVLVVAFVVGGFGVGFLRRIKNS